MIGPSLALIVVAFFSVTSLHGTANTIDWIALRLHDFAKSMREMHARRTAEVNQRWMRSLER